MLHVRSIGVDFQNLIKSLYFNRIIGLRARLGGVLGVVPGLPGGTLSLVKHNEFDNFPKNEQILHLRRIGVTISSKLIK